MTKKPKVLMIEDLRAYHELMQESVGNKITLLSAFTVEAAKELFYKNPDIELIVMDYYMPGPKENTTINLLREIRPKFKGKILATSSTTQDELLENGCDTKCYKIEAPKKVAEILDLK